MPTPLPPRPHLDHLRSEAKALLRSARVGDAEALERLASVPRLSGLGRDELAARAVLADAQHAVAGGYGFASWARLKHEMESREPLAEQAGRFLAAIREHRRVDAARLLERHPDLARAELSVTCALGDVEAIATALAADPGAATRPRQPDGWPPLLYVAGSPLHDQPPARALALARTATLLLDAGASANTGVPWEGDPEARLPALYFASSRGNVAVTRVLLERGANPNDGESIYHAAEVDQRECLELLLAHGADVRGRHAHWGNTPLYFLMGHHEGGAETPAADRGIRWLLEHGADPEVTSGPLAETALQCAARVGRHEPMIELLLSHGAEVSRARTDGATPYALALRHGHARTAAALLAAGADGAGVSALDRFMAGCFAADEAAARRELAAAPGLVADLDREGRGQLAEAAARGEVPALRLMLALGFSPDWESAWAGTPLHHAAWHGRSDCVRELLARGAAVNVRDAVFGSSALAWACHGAMHCREADPDYLAVVDLLLDAGADRATSINRWGLPPERMGREAITARLVERGFATPDALDADG